MSATHKRKTPSTSEKKSKNKTSEGVRSGAEYPNWFDDGISTIVSVLPDQGVVFVGSATLMVDQGCVEVLGKLVAAGSAPVPLTTGGRGGMALLLHARGLAHQVPFACTAVVQFRLRSTPASDQPSPSASGTGADAAASGAMGEAGQAAAGGSSSSMSAAPAALRRSFWLYRRSEDEATAGGNSAPSPSPASSSSSSTPAMATITPEWRQAAERVAQAAAAAAQGAGPPVVVAVCGAKGLGKSTFARLLVNALLNVCPAVAYADTDCGQPELTPPGLVSLTLVAEPLVGPAYANARGQQQVAHFVGDTSPQGDPEHYLRCAASLFGWHAASAASAAATGRCPPPLVVNTHGWIKGLGYELMVRLMESLDPTHVVQVVCGVDKKDLPRGAFWRHGLGLGLDGGGGGGGGGVGPCRATVLHIASPERLGPVGEGVHNNGRNGDAAKRRRAGAEGDEEDADALDGDDGDGGGGGGSGADEPAAFSGRGGGRTPGGGGGQGQGQGQGQPPPRQLKAVEARALQWHAWARLVLGLHPAWGSYDGDDFWLHATRLAAAPPYAVSLDDVDVRFMHAQPAPGQLGYAINGLVVGLLAEEPAAGHNGRESAGNLQAAAGGGGGGGGPPSALPPPPCVGLGLVRAVDMDKRLLYILTPVAEHDLQRVTALQANGRLELPPTLLQAANLMPLHCSLHGVAAAATGAGAIKSRKNILRTSLVRTM